MNNFLNKLKVAILVTDGFEQIELTKPRESLDLSGATTHLIAPDGRTVRGWNHTEWGDSFPVDVPLESARPEYYDALLFPGGVLNPDSLRQEKKAVAFVKSFFDAGKPVAAICHGPQLLIEAEVLQGRTLTSYPSLRKDIENAGACWVDQRVVIDNGLITSRNPHDIPEFNEAMNQEFSRQPAAESAL
ncbi:type 1 glutamine amidotransferase domain-containing protein [Arundinibacter roseus]|uniref:Type 1 glutamine amidotransferase n=1 Tax=Arundinibacter roseus TaxID=2070510 RepID=A0A4R4K7Z3_9BACT|nr:type 1 glutamine amidotransferase domain-containing protein [Arundinibacter roseus]TDB62299.1 type 1 glutamine amidotransferase [Arundinibacter roseus]